MCYVRTMATTPSRPRRQRAPRRAGVRRQMTIPAALWDTACAYAEEHSTTPNDAIVLLASQAAQRVQRDTALRERADTIRAMVLDGRASVTATSEMLTEDEALHAAMALRDGR